MIDMYLAYTNFTPTSYLVKEIDSNLLILLSGNYQCDVFPIQRSLMIS